MLLDNFPKNVAPRQSQIQILRELESALNRGYKRIIISAPTGIGKSYIAKTIANSMGTSFIVTSTKQLQDQYVEDFPTLKSVKGMSNFACYQQMDLAKLHEKRAAMRKGLTCDKGQCARKEGQKQVSSCKYKSSSEDARQCIYYKQKAEGLAFPQTILNYAIYFQLKKFQATSQGVCREMGIFDEAHTIENEIVRFLGLDVWAGYLSDVGIAPSRYKLDDIDEIISLLEDLRTGYGKRLADMESDSMRPRSVRDAQEYSRMLNRFERVVDARAMIQANKENFVIQMPETDHAGGFRRLSVVPVDIDKFAEKFFDSDYQVFLSATIDRENFSRSLGLEDCALINMTKSPFPKENRKVRFLNVKRLNQSSSLEDRIEVINQIGAIMRSHQNERGLILTSSKKRCDDIRRYLPKEQRGRIQLAHSENEDGSTIEETLAAHKETKNGVLLSSSLWQGIDLRDDLSRFQIIEKCPYLYLGDRRVMIKKERDPRWYRYQTVVKLLQGIGRSVRSQSDHAITYVVDESVHNLLAYNREMVPLAYHDIIYG